jgi:hypothetical protein
MARAARLLLRSCPLCGSGWVARCEREALAQPHENVAVRCGSCGTWRRVLTNRWAAGAYERGLERDRARMAGMLERFERDQMTRVARLFSAALEHDLVDAGDFAVAPPGYARADH